MANVTHRVAGSNPPIRLTARAIDENGDNVVVNLTSLGATGLSATAKNVETGTTINFTSATVTNGTAGEITLAYATNTFAAGRYTVQVRFTDSSSNVHVYPYDGNSAQLIVREAN